MSAAFYTGHRSSDGDTHNREPQPRRSGIPPNELRMMGSENAAKLYRHPLPEVILPLD